MRRIRLRLGVHSSTARVNLNPNHTILHILYILVKHPRRDT